MTILLLFSLYIFLDGVINVRKMSKTRSSPKFTRKHLMQFKFYFIYRGVY